MARETRQCATFGSRLAAAVFLLVLGAALTIELFTHHATANADAERMAGAMSLALAQRIGGTIREIDGLLDDMAGEVLSGTWADPIHRLRIEGRLAAYRDLAWIGMVSPNGRMDTYTVPTLVKSPDGLDVSDQDFFTAHAIGQAPKRFAFVGAPVISRLTGERNFHLSHAVRDRDGRLEAVVVAAISANQIAAIIEELLLDKEGGSALIHANGRILARAPDHAGKFGVDISNSDLFTKWLPSSPAGVARLISKADGNDKIVAYRRLDRYPLVVTSGLSTRQAFQAWRDTAMVEIGSFLLFAMAALYWATKSDLRAGQLLQHKAQLEEAVRIRTTDLENAKSLAEQRAAHIEAINDKIARLSQVAAHQLQEPVRSVVSFSQLLRRRLAILSPEADDDLRFIEDGGRQLKKTLEGFRQYTELLSTMPSFQQVDLRKCVEGALASLSDEIAKVGAQIHVHDLPVVMGDPTLLASVVAKLADNALRYRHPERPPLIEVSGAVLDNGWRLTIEDNGIGLPPHPEQLFVPFNRPTTEASGGMGLAFCQAVAEVLGGQIHAERLDQGSRFTLTIGAMA